ncbi:hypothetical protein B5X24_HaOG201289 [Helicoverpa armigera]|nr:hypothetical protein B5X24_HaOG201289 [Helicoverpa armigera]
MSYCLRLLLVLIICVKQEAELAIAFRKFVYQKDMSEYCRRRVMPSVFLGRQVIEAYSQILHFSRLELPYSCFVSISTTKRRTWSTTRSSKDALKKSTSQQDTIVFEFPILNVSATVVPGRISVDSDFEPLEAFDEGVAVKTWPGVSYKTKILPLVQFSLADVVNARRTTEDAAAPRYEVDFNADLLYTPDPRCLVGKYLLSPIKNRFHFYYCSLKFPLLQLPVKSKPLNHYKYNVNSRLDFKKNKNLLREKELKKFYETPPYVRFPMDSQGPSDIFSTSNDIQTKLTTHSWDEVNAILKNLSRTKDDVVNKKVDENLANLLQGLAKIGHNENVNLVPNASWYTRRVASTPRPATIMYQTGSITWRQPSASYRTNYFEEIEDSSAFERMTHEDNKSITLDMTTSINDYVTLLPPVLDVDQLILNATQQRNAYRNTSGFPEIISEVSGTTTTTPETMKPVTLLDHESWENMVHAAPRMAVMLNSVTSSEVNTKQETNGTLSEPNTRNTARRKKRFIHAIPIEHAKPRRIPVNHEVPPSTEPVDSVSDAQEFQRLIEVQDDEAQDRVALRYLGQYVGPALFNICDFSEATSRHVYLFNSSRLVLAIGNFTLERMTVVMTPARTLLTTEARCGTANLECQVSGARVCIDSLSACDGVPNCGSYDIYDEDRLTCGGAAGLQHNVCLAAITFLAVLLTILYTVHYWLKRCVPKVSDAFFIYTDAAENVLYLDPIMRSPNDTGFSKFFYQPRGMHEYMEHPGMQRRHKTVCSYLMDRFQRIFRLKRTKRFSGSLRGIAEADYDGLDVIDSFGEIELGKLESALTADVAVQTGSSLEIEGIERVLVSESLDIINSDYDFEAYPELKSIPSDNGKMFDDNMLANQPSEELNMLKFFRKSRSISMQMSSRDISDIAARQQPDTEDKETQSVEFYEEFVTASLLSVIDEVPEKKPGHGIVRKKLRFEGETKAVDADEENAQEEEVIPEKRRRSVMFGGKHLADSDSDSNEPTTSNANKEFKSYFWSKNKNKKPTKKKSQQLPLR